MLRRLTTLIHLARREQRQSFQESPAASPLGDLQKRKKGEKKESFERGSINAAGNWKKPRQFPGDKKNRPVHRSENYYLLSLRWPRNSLPLV